MDAVMYLKEKARMTKNCCIPCDKCYLSKTLNGYHVICQVLERLHTEEAISIVEAWSKEHPMKTYLSDLLEKYPKTGFYINGIPKVCAKNLGYRKDCPDERDCISCWNTTMEE